MLLIYSKVFNYLLMNSDFIQVKGDLEPRPLFKGYFSFISILVLCSAL